MVILRRELPEDRAAIRSVHTAAFASGGRKDVPEAQLVDALRDDGDAIAALSLVATLATDVIGHVVCSRGRLGDRPLLGLGPLGFVLAEPLGILPPDPAWTRHFQVRLLSTWDTSLRGTFRYAHAFDSL